MEMDHIKDIKIKGIGKFFHKIFLFLTYPIRHIFKFLIALVVLSAVLFAVALFYDVPTAEIPAWYLAHLQSASTKVNDKIETAVSEISSTAKEDQQYQEVQAPKIIRKNPSAKSEKIRREGFKRPEVVFQKPMKTRPIAQKRHEDLPIQNPQLRQTTNAKEALETALKAQRLPAHETPDAPIRVERKILEEKPISKPEKIISDNENTENSYYRKDPNLPIVYEDTPQEISGRSIVFSASEMSVGDYYIILYGIYTDPKSPEAKQVFEYLRKNIEGRELNCNIVAYTRNHIATAVCFINGESLNRRLVDLGLAKNIAL